MALLPCGVHFESYEKDMAYIHTRAQWICFVLFLILLMLLPTFLSVRFLAMINMAVTKATPACLRLNFNNVCFDLNIF